MDDYWQSLRACTLNPVSPNAPSFWACLSPLSSGTKDTFLQLITTFATKYEWSNSSLVFPTTMMLQNPTTLAQKLQRVCQNCSNRQINHSKMQHNGVPAMWLDLVCLSACCILLHALILSETDFVSQAYLDSFLTMTNNQIRLETNTSALAQHVPDTVLFGPQNCEQPDNLPRAAWRQRKSFGQRGCFPACKVSTMSSNKLMSSGPNLPRQ